MITKLINKKGKKAPQGHFIEFNDQVVELGDFFSVGRHPSNHLALLEDPFTSQKHCRIEKKGDGYIVKDLKSRNGTLLNGESIHEAPLKAFDEIQVGNSCFLYRENFDLKSEVPSDFYQSKNTLWQKELEKIEAFGRSDLPVLIQGPSGAGKELISRALHYKSSRAYEELISINCSAFNEQLIESELFGHIEGAFTGATKSRNGAFQQAKGGTLILDEIGDLPLNLQPKLLRALENKEIRPVGSDKTIKTDVRIIAATHKDLAQKVKSGEFREDLYYRLSPLSLKAPSLKDRMQDFEQLLFNFAREHKIRFSPLAIEELKKHSWPGNIRELKNLVMRASVLHKKDGVSKDDVLNLIGESPKETEKSPESIDFQRSKSIVKEIEREMIFEALKESGGNQRQAAKSLGMAKSTLHDKVKRYFQQV